MNDRKSVLIIGEKPELVDFSDPAIPPGLNAQKISEGLQSALQALRERGYEAAVALTTTEDAVVGEITQALREKHYDCIVVGAGLRIVPRMTRIFETIMNVLREHAPTAKLAFNTSPEDSVAAVERQLRGSRP